jgi:putative FmdB family regulatory protein
LVPTYEYRCPDGHLFEVFKSMTAPAPEACPVCGKGPVEVVLHPVAVHFKGSGFYSTDYGRGRRKTEASKDGDSGSAEKSSEKKDPVEKKAAEA